MHCGTPTEHQQSNDRNKGEQMTQRPSYRASEPRYTGHRTFYGGQPKMTARNTKTRKNEQSD